MSMHQAKYESALDKLRADMAENNAYTAKRDAEFAERDEDNTRWQVSMWVAAILTLGAWIRWPF